MRKLYLFLLMVIISFSLHAQHDFFVLREKDKTIKSYYEDLYIRCELADQQWVEGMITAVRNDSIFIQPFHINYLITIWHTLLPDTIKDEPVNIPVKDIYALPLKNTSPLPVISKGLEAGGLVYDALNIINGVAKKEAVFRSDNLSYLISGAGVSIAGWILHFFAPPTVAIIGKKYHIEYMGNTSSQ